MTPVDAVDRDAEAMQEDERRDQPVATSPRIPAARRARARAWAVLVLMPIVGFGWMMASSKPGQRDPLTFAIMNGLPLVLGLCAYVWIRLRERRDLARRPRFEPATRFSTGIEKRP